MNIYAINGSPRKNWNTATLLQKALDGAQAANPSCHTEMIHLYDLNYTGCKSCFACKRLGAKTYGACAAKDDLAPVLEKLSRADGIIFGTPIYFGSMTGMMLAFLERLLFPYLVYDANFSSIAPKKMKTAFVYTMNLNEEAMKGLKYPERLGLMEQYLGGVFTPPQALYSCDTCQFDDYSKYKVECFSGEAKYRHRETQFPVDCDKAFALGKSLAAQ